MQRVELSPDTLRRLSQLDTHGRPVLSAYFNLDPREFGTQPARDVQLGALQSEMQREARAANQRGDRELKRELKADIERVEQAIGDTWGLANGAHGLAIFCADSGAVFELIELPDPVPTLAAIDTVPWLEPIAAAAADDRIAVGVFTRPVTRLFVGGPHRLVQFAAIEDEIHGRHDQGGWAQARYQRAIEKHVADHVRRSTEALLRAHKRQPFSRIVLTANDELAPVVAENLNGELRQRLIEIVRADLGHANVEEILTAVAPVVERARQVHRGELLDQLAARLGKNDSACSGIEDVVPALELERVEALLVINGAPLRAMQCESCGRLSPPQAKICPYDKGRLGEVDALEHTVELAGRQAAEIAIYENDTKSLTDRGSIAALLRW